MQLTNYSFLSSRLDHISSGAARKVAMQRISSGNRLENGKTDAGALSASLRLRSIDGNLAEHKDERTSKSFNQRFSLLRQNHTFF